MANRKVTVTSGMVLHEGVVYKTGEELTLSDTQIEYLKDVVEPSNPTAAQEAKKPEGGKPADGKPEGDK